MSEALSITPTKNSFELQEKMDKRKALRRKMCAADFSFHSPPSLSVQWMSYCVGLFSTWVSRDTVCCGHSMWSGVGIHDSWTWVWTYVGFTSDSIYNTNTSSSKWTSVTTDWTPVISQLLPSLLPIQELFPTNTALCCTSGLFKHIMKYLKLLLCQF